MNQELLKVEYLFKLSKYFGNFAKECFVARPFDCQQGYRFYKIPSILRFPEHHSPYFGDTRNILSILLQHFCQDSCRTPTALLSRDYSKRNRIL